MRHGSVEGRRSQLMGFLRLVRYLRPHWGPVLLTVSVLIGDSMVRLMPPYLTKVALDDYVLSGSLDGVSWVMVLYAGALVAGFALEACRVVMLQWTGQRAIFSLRTEVFNKLLQMSRGSLQKRRQGDLLSAALNDVEVVNNFFTQGLVVLFSDLIMLVGITVILLVMDLGLASAVLSITPVLAVATLMYRGKALKAHRFIRAQTGRLNSFLNENINGMTTVHLCNAQRQRLGQFRHMNSQLLGHHREAILYTSLFFPFVEVVAALALGLVVGLGGGRVIHGVITPGVLVAFIQYLRRFFQPIRDLAEKYDLLQGAMAASERVFGLMDTQAEVLEAPRCRSPKIKRGEVVFKDVWFSYEPGHWVIRGLDIAIAPGSTTALVGVTGAGKSSLIHMMYRAHEPQRGEILIDGVDVRLWRLKELRRFVGVIPQDVYLLNGSVLDNLRLWDQDVPEEKVRMVAQALGVDRMIRSLPGGYGAQLSPRGENLSLGQRQLLAMVRAFIYDPRVLIMDEATSAVDPLTESMLQRALHVLARGRTMIIIAHRLSTIRGAQRIVVLHQGEAVEDGTHGELIKKDGLYRRLLEAQIALGSMGRTA